MSETFIAGFAGGVCGYLALSALLLALRQWKRSRLDEFATLLPRSPNPFVRWWRAL